TTWPGPPSSGPSRFPTSPAAIGSRLTGAPPPSPRAPGSATPPRATAGSPPPTSSPASNGSTTSRPHRTGSSTPASSPGPERSVPAKPPASRAWSPPNARTLQITLDRPAGDFLSILTQTFFAPVPGEYAAHYQVGPTTRATWSAPAPTT